MGETVERTDRRAVLTAGAATAGAMALTLLGRREAQAHGTSHVTSATGDPAIHGENSDDGDGVLGTSVGGRGVVGFGALVGVHGESVAGFGVQAISHSGTAVAVGTLSGIGVDIHSGGTALRITGGRLKLTQVGSGAVPAGTDLVFIPRADVTANTHVSVALTADPGPRAAVSWIERVPGAGFTVHLTARVRNATTLTYSVAEPAFP